MVSYTWNNTGILYKSPDVILLYKIKKGYISVLSLRYNPKYEEIIAAGTAPAYTNLNKLIFLYNIQDAVILHIYLLQGVFMKKGYHNCSNFSACLISLLLQFLLQFDYIDGPFYLKNHYLITNFIVPER